MKTTIGALVMGLLLAGVAASAQTPAAPATQGRQGALPPPPPPPAPKPAAPPAARSATNIRVDVTVIEEGGPQPVRKTVTLTSVDGLRASSRSVAGFGAPFETNLHVDATPTLERNGKIQTRIVVFYRPDPSSPGGEGNRQNAASVNLDFPIVLDSGKTLVASQTTDPGRDRRVTVEVTATILK
jgi:hypothetical protein